MRKRTFKHVRPTKSQSVCASAQSDQSLRCQHDKMHPSRSKICLVKILIRLLECDFESSLHGRTCEGVYKASGYKHYPCLMDRYNVSREWSAKPAHVIIFAVHLGPVVQGIVRLTNSLVVKMLTVLVSTISNTHVFLLNKNVSRFCKCKSCSHFFSAKY